MTSPNQESLVYFRSEKTNNYCSYTTDSSRAAHGTDKKYIYCDHSTSGPTEVFRMVRDGQMWKMYTNVKVGNIDKDSLVYVRKYRNSGPDGNKNDIHQNVASFTGDHENGHDGTYKIHTNDDNTFCFKSMHRGDSFCAVENEHVKHGLRCDRGSCGDWEKFTASYAPGNTGEFPTLGIDPLTEANAAAAAEAAAAGNGTTPPDGTTTPTVTTTNTPSTSMCSSYQCPTGKKRKADAQSLIGNTAEKCCVDERSWGLIGLGLGLICLCLMGVLAILFIAARAARRREES